MVPGLQETLLSVGQLCDSGCSVTFTKSEALVHHNGAPILRALRHGPSGLWKLPVEPLLPRPPPCPQAQFALGAINPRAPIAQRIAFYHAMCFSPALSTWCEAIDSGFLTTFPELTSAIHPLYEQRLWAIWTRTVQTNARRAQQSPTLDDDSFRYTCSMRPRYRRQHIPMQRVDSSYHPVMATPTS